MGRKLEAPHGDLYSRWLENVFKHVQPANKKMEAAIRALPPLAEDAGCTLKKFRERDMVHFINRLITIIQAVNLPHASLVWSPLIDLSANR